MTSCMKKNSSCVEAAFRDNDAATTCAGSDADRIVHFVSYPKSGRTWLEVMLAKLVSLRTGWDVGAIVRNEIVDDAWHSCSLRRPYFSHGRDNWKTCQTGTVNLEFYANKAVVLLVRDPRDVVVSAYHEAVSRRCIFHGDLDQFIDYPHRDAPPRSPQARFGIRAIVSYLNAWAAARTHLGSFCLFAYEDIKADTQGALAAVARLIGLEHSQEELQSAVAYGSVRNMRRLEETGELAWHGLAIGKGEQGRKVRKAQVGSYLHEMTPEQLSRVEKVIYEQLDPFYDRYLREPTDIQSSKS